MEVLLKHIYAYYKVANTQCLIKHDRLIHETKFK